jgi:hypothetical protein
METQSEKDKIGVRSSRRWRSVALAAGAAEVTG